MRTLIFFTLLLPTIVCAQWRDLDPEQTAVMTIDGQRVVIELNSRFAPKTSASFTQAVKQGFYDGLSFYRVIDGFVAQGGDGSDMADAPMPHPTLPAEFELPSSKGLPFVSAQKPDLFAPETGFVDGFAAARITEHEATWLIHCPGVIAMARGTEADSGATDFYIVIGQAPRYLDRNLTIFGRVVEGMPAIQKIRRGETAANGIIEDAAARTIISSIKMAADLSPPERRLPQVIDTNSKQFAQTMAGRRARTHEFFHVTPPAVLDACQVPLATRQPPPTADE